MNKKIIISLITLVTVLVGSILAWQLWPKQAERPKVNLVRTKLANISPEYFLVTHKVRFSPDGKRVAFGAMKDGKWHLILDEKEFGPYEIAWDFVFSPDSQHFAFGVEKEGEWYLILDGEEIGPYSDFWDSTFSPNSQHFVFGTIKKGKNPLVLNGKELPQKYDRIYGPFSFDSESRYLSFGALIDNSL